MERESRPPYKSYLDNMMISRADQAYRNGNLETAIVHLRSVVYRHQDNEEAKSILDNYISEQHHKNDNAQY